MFFMKLGLGSLQAFNIVWLRFLLAFLIAGILFYKRLMLVTKKVIISSFMLGTLLFGVFTFVTFGVSMTSASNAGFLVSGRLRKRTGGSSWCVGLRNVYRNCRIVIWLNCGRSFS